MKGEQHKTNINVETSINEVYYLSNMSKNFGLWVLFQASVLPLPVVFMRSLHLTHNIVKHLKHIKLDFHKAQEPSGSYGPQASLCCSGTY